MNRSLRAFALLALTSALTASGCGDDSATPGGATSTTGATSGGGGDGGSGGDGGEGQGGRGGGAGGAGSASGGGGAGGDGAGGSGGGGDASTSGGGDGNAGTGDGGNAGTGDGGNASTGGGGGGGAGAGGGDAGGSGDAGGGGAGGAPVCGDARCEAPETCDTCAGDCGECPPVCGDGVCDLMRETCQACATDCGDCPPAECSHDLCDEGAPLLDGCDPCVTALCAEDPACCMSAWDAGCVDRLATVCGRACGCAHDLCEAGAQLDPSCNSCVATVCDALEGDSFCCTVGWDEMCVALANVRCGASCP